MVFFPRVCFSSPAPSLLPAPRRARPRLRRSLTVPGAPGTGYQKGVPGVALLGLGVPEEPGVDRLWCPGLTRLRDGLLQRPRPPPG